MSQQINLCSPVLLTKKHYFSARSIVQLLGFSLAVVLVAFYFMVSSTIQANMISKAHLVRQTHELDEMKKLTGKILADPGERDLLKALEADLKSQRDALYKAEQILMEMGRGQVIPGMANSDYLQMIAASIPSDVWVTQISINDDSMILKGVALDPSSIKLWVSKLTNERIMADRQLRAVDIYKMAGARPQWSFELVSKSSFISVDAHE